MRQIVLVLLTVAAAVSRASVITDITVTNLSSPDLTFATANGQVEFRSQVVAVTPPVSSGPYTTFSAQLAWLFAARVPAPIGRPVSEEAEIGYEIAMTVQDPTNAGYLIGVNSRLFGYQTLMWWEEPGALATDLPDFLARAAAGGGPSFPVPSLRLPGNTTAVGEQIPELNDPLLSLGSTFAVFAAGGTETYRLRYLSSTAKAGTTGAAGEVALRFGLQPTLAGFALASTPGPDGEPPDLMGLTTEVYVLSFAQDPLTVPEPASWASVALGLAGLGVWRRKRTGP